jgi:hypothetical protein
VGLVAALATAVAAAAGCSGGGAKAGAARDGGAEQSAVAEAAVTSAAGAGEAPPETSAGGDAVADVATPVEPVTTGPRVIQTASVTLTVARNRFEEAISSARTIVAGLGGFVTGSSASQGGGQRLVQGTLVVRVPAAAYDRAMSQLARLGQVEARTETGEDVSQQFVDLGARRAHLEAVEAQLLEFLEKTRTVGEALAVQNRLDDVQLQLEQVRGQLRYLDDQTAYATISLTVSERGIPVARPADGGWGVADAWHAAVRGLEQVAGGIFVALVTAGPILLALGLAFIGGRWALRRRRSRGGASATSAPSSTPPA